MLEKLIKYLYCDLKGLNFTFNFRTVFNLVFSVFKLLFAQISKGILFHNYVGYLLPEQLCLMYNLNVPIYGYQ